VLAFGRADAISVVTSMIATMVLLMHISVGSVLALAHIVSAHRKRA